MEIRNFIRSVLKEMASRNEFKIERASHDEYDELIGVCDKSLAPGGFEFTKGMRIDKLCSQDPNRRISTLYDADNTFKATMNGQIVGFYFLSEKQPLEQFVEFFKQRIGTKDFDVEKYEELLTKRGVQGVAVAVLPEFKGTGIGKALLELPSTLGYDYIWGVQTKMISDIEQWTKRRKILLSSPDDFFHITYQEF